VTEAEDVYREALEVYERLADEFPARPVYVDGLASACLNLSLVAAAGERTGERRSLLERSVAGFEELHEADENSAQYARGLTIALAQLGHALHGSGGDARRTDDVLSRALEIGMELWDRNRDDADLRTALVWTCNIRASARLKRGDAAAGAEAARVYVDLDPTPVELVWSASFLAGAVGVGQSTGASIDDLAAWTEEAIELLDRAAGEAADDPLVRKEMVEPAFDAIADDERYRGLMELLGIER
jgi:hypothetical protein